MTIFYSCHHKSIPNDKKVVKGKTIQLRRREPCKYSFSSTDAKCKGCKQRGAVIKDK